MHMYVVIIAYVIIDLAYIYICTYVYKYIMAEYTCLYVSPLVNIYYLTLRTYLCSILRQSSEQHVACNYYETCVI